MIWLLFGKYWEKIGQLFVASSGHADLVHLSVFWVNSNYTSKVICDAEGRLLYNNYYGCYMRFLSVNRFKLTAWQLLLITLPRVLVHLFNSTKASNKKNYLWLACWRNSNDSSFLKLSIEYFKEVFQIYFFMNANCET